MDTWRAEPSRLLDDPPEMEKIMSNLKRVEQMRRRQCRVVATFGALCFVLLSFTGVIDPLANPWVFPVSTLFVAVVGALVVQFNMRTGLF